MTSRETSVTEKTSSTAAPWSWSSKFVIMLIMMIGIGLGYGLGYGSSKSSTDADEINGMIRSYIADNPGFVLEVLTKYNQQQRDEARQQALNLVKVNDGKTIIGNPDGDVTIYEFSDYNCGYCKRVFADLMDLVREDGNIRLVIKEFPILAETSMQAAQISMAAAELGRFEEVHTALMQWPGRMDASAFSRILEDAGINPEEIQAEIEKGQINAMIAQTQAAADALDIGGTPAFVIGNEIAPGAISRSELAAMVARARNN
ncbi:MAG: DsbA family protein [Bacteroidetes bacterium]|nr:DsbA family protein [Bacteroidota bacterium]